MRGSPLSKSAPKSFRTNLVQSMPTETDRTRSRMILVEAVRQGEDAAERRTAARSKIESLCAEMAAYRATTESKIAALDREIRECGHLQQAASSAVVSLRTMASPLAAESIARALAEMQRCDRQAYDDAQAATVASRKVIDLRKGYEDVKAQGKATHQAMDELQSEIRAAEAIESSLCQRAAESARRHSAAVAAHARALDAALYEGSDGALGSPAGDASDHRAQSPNHAAQRHSDRRPSRAGVHAMK